MTAPNGAASCGTSTGRAHRPGSVSTGHGPPVKRVSFSLRWVMGWVWW